jgi:hypothetical protein
MWTWYHMLVMCVYVVCSWSCLLELLSVLWSVHRRKFHCHYFKYEVWSKISGTIFFTEKLQIVLKWQPCRILGNVSWRHIPEEWVAAWISREWVDLQCNLVCPSIVLWNGSARNLVRWPQKRTKCYNRLSDKQRWVGPRHLSGIADFKKAARPTTIHTQAGIQRWEPTRLLTMPMR